jgi:cell shape-determining protein MreC
MIPPALARRLLPITFCLLAALTFLIPIRYLTWLNGFGRLTQTIVAPVSGPMSLLSRWVSPPTRAPGDTEEIQHLKLEAESFHVQLLQALGENDRLRTQIADLQRGRALDPDLAIQQITVSVIGSASDVVQGQLTVRAGRRQGVDVNTVATALGLQLVGRVTAVGTLTCTIAPITTKAAGTLRAVISIDDTASGLGCTLAATGDGTLSGDVEDRRDAKGLAIEPKVGQEVRLSDPSHWPRTAQMLLIGHVEKVEPSPKQPLRRVVTVRPTLDNIERVSEVVLRISPEPATPDVPVPTAPKRPASGGPK